MARITDSQYDIALAFIINTVRALNRMNKILSKLYKDLKEAK